MNHKNFELSSLEFNPTKKIVRIKNIEFGGELIQLIVGPCAVESREQLELVARDVSRVGIKIIRGGVFKPRTNPYSFQGLGEKGLELLASVGEEFGLVTETEVMDPRMVRVASGRIDVLRVGARNMQNYDLLKELGKVENPVIIKNGLCSTIEEHLAAAEYVLAGGNPNVILCERGSRGFEPLERFCFDALRIPILKSLTNLPVISDPSHAAGERELVLPLSRAQIGAGADGLIIEAHANPIEALTDSSQQIESSKLGSFVSELNKVAVSVGRRIDLGE